MSTRIRARKAAETLDRYGYVLHADHITVKNKRFIWFLIYSSATQTKRSQWMSLSRSEPFKEPFEYREISYCEVH